MSITNPLRKNAGAAPARPAAAALQALRTRSADLAREDAEWQHREETALAEIRERDEAEAEFQHFRGRLFDALAARELNPSAPDPAGMRLRADEAQARAARLRERGAVAERVLAQVRTERERIRTAQRDLTRQLAPTVHAAAAERMRETAAELLAAEARYLRAIADTFGASSLCDRVARELATAGMPHPGFCDGVLAVNRLFLPRPTGPAFRPVPKHDDIARAINDAARALEKELLG